MLFSSPRHTGSVASFILVDVENIRGGPHSLARDLCVSFKTDNESACIVMNNSAILLRVYNFIKFSHCRVSRLLVVPAMPYYERAQ